MAGEPIWYELMVPDPGAVAPFYKAVVGWDIPATGQTMPNGSDYRMIGRADGGNAGGVLKLTDGMIQAGATGGWIPYFHVEDVDAALAKTRDLSGHIGMPAMTMEAGTIAMVSDPQGAHFYLMKPTPPPGNPDAKSDVFKPGGIGHCQWNELETSDEPGATAFYTSLFGWSADNTMPMGEHGNYRFLDVDGTAFGAINPWLADYMSVGWLPYFGVADIAAAKTAAEANGGTITHDIHEVPGGDFIFTAADPAGAPVGFVGKKGA